MTTKWWGRLWGDFYYTVTGGRVDITITPVTVTMRLIPQTPTVSGNADVSRTRPNNMRLIPFTPRLTSIANGPVLLDSQKELYSAIYDSESNSFLYPQTPSAYALYRNVVNAYRYPNLFILRDGSVSTTQVLGGFEQQDPVKTYIWGNKITALDSFDVTALTNAGYTGIAVGSI